MIYNRRAWVFCAAILVTGCYADFDYEYIALERSMEVIEYGQTELRNVRDHDDMPVRYKLERDQYIIYAALDKGSIPPAVVFTVEGKTMIGAQIDGASIRCIAYFEAIRPTQLRHGYPEGGIRFKWKPDIDYAPCRNETIPIGEDRRLVISVYDGANGLVANEEIVFEILTNGIYREYDGP